MVTGGAEPGVINMFRPETTIFQELLVDQRQVQRGFLPGNGKRKFGPLFGK